MRRMASLGLILALVSALPLIAQEMPKSPEAGAQTQVGAGYSKWVSVSYSAPILRGRTGIFGEGDAYGKQVLAGAPLWRAGANVTTRLKTEADLDFGGHQVPAGEYSLFIELKSPTEWTLVISSQPAMAAFDRAKMPAQTWGAYGYSADHDVARVAMSVQPPLVQSIDQLMWVFSDVSETGGTLGVIWDHTVANASFTVVAN